MGSEVGETCVVPGGRGQHLVANMGWMVTVVGPRGGVSGEGRDGRDATGPRGTVRRGWLGGGAGRAARTRY